MIETSFVVLDVEVVHSPDEPGYSWSDPHALGLSVACTWSEPSAIDGEHGLRQWRVSTVSELIEYLRGFTRVVTFNGIRFDFPVLGPEVAALLKGKTVDLFCDLHHASGQMLGLDRVARGTLGRGKSGSGANAPAMWARGEHQAVREYCEDDVLLTRDLYLHGLYGRPFRVAADGKRKAWTGTARWSLR